MKKTLTALFIAITFLSIVITLSPTTTLAGTTVTPFNHGVNG